MNGRRSNERIVTQSRFGPGRLSVGKVGADVADASDVTHGFLDL